MYDTCLFCHSRLGSNEVLEPFPVGRRLAFDGSRGRLWVVCPSCGRWNLSPLEERWEALESCERFFRETRTRVATENIGLARLAGGLDLIRIGRPMRPEFAGWRYGRELLRRRKRDLAGAAGVIGGAAGVVAASAAGAVLVTPALAVAVPVLSVIGVVAGQRVASNRVVAREPDTGGAQRLILRKDLRSVVFRPAPADGGLGVAIQRGDGWIELSGTAAERVASVTCARRNQTGASERQVGDAVHLLEEQGGPDDLLRHIAARGEFNHLWYRERIALEISLHEEMERRALEGELAELERAWQQAEEIAAIADRLLLPSGIDDWIEKTKHDAAPTAKGIPAELTDETEST